MELRPYGDSETKAVLTHGGRLPFGLNERVGWSARGVPRIACQLIS